VFLHVDYYCLILFLFFWCQKFPLVKTRKNEEPALQIRRLIFASPLGYPTFKGVMKINLKCQYLFVIYAAINLVSSNWNKFRTDPSWWTWDGLAPTSCSNAGKLYYYMIRRRITEIIVTPNIILINKINTFDFTRSGHWNRAEWATETGEGIDL